MNSENERLSGKVVNEDVLDEREHIARQVENLDGHPDNEAMASNDQSVRPNYRRPRRPSSESNVCCLV
jgi:hypothetical protein